jgi:diaminopimelate epimerase
MHLFAADRELTCWNVTVGVPHSVMFVDDADTYADAADFHLLGNAVRHHNDMAPAGTNLNVVSRIQSGHWRMRTYERGVEAETLACGTGAVASSLVIRHVMSEPWPMRIRVSGGRDLSVAESDTDAITLTGHAAIIFTGDLGPDALLDQDSSQNTRRNSAES